MARKLKVCFDRVLPRNLRRPQSLGGGALGGRTRAAVEIGKLWPNGSTLRVRFLGGTSNQHATVRKYATQWAQHANLQLAFGDYPDAEIRIAFQDDGAWSYIGKDCLDVPRDAATMNFGWLDEGVVLHEFGHALGMIHEHQNPVGGIQWNKPQVYRDLGGSPNFWDRATVDHNMFRQYDRDLINGTALDPRSIMLYAVPKTWTLDGFESRPNEVLSSRDREFIGSPKAYPRVPGGVVPVELPVHEAAATPGRIGAAGEEDLYTFTASKAGRFAIETEGATDVVMTLYGPDSPTRQIAEDDDSAGGRNARIVASLIPGQYVVQVRHYNSRGGTGSYGIRVMRHGAGSARAARRVTPEVPARAAAVRRGGRTRAAQPGAEA